MASNPSAVPVLASFGLGALFGAGLWYLLPGLTWWIYPAFAFLCAAIAFPQILQMLANEQIIRSGDDKPK